MTDDERATDDASASEDAPATADEQGTAAGSTDESGTAGGSGIEDVGVRVRGIYATALTKLLASNGFDVVQASEPIRERFDDGFAVAPADVSIETTRDRQGVEISGESDAVGAVAGELESVAVDAFRWSGDVPRGAVFDVEVVEASGGSGAVVDLGNGRRGYLQYDDVDGYVDAGNRYRVQVREPTPPWDDDRPRVEPTIAVRDGLVTLSRGRSGVSAAASGPRADELVGMTDLLSADVPDGWGVRWRRAAVDADLEAMGAALERASDGARALEDAGATLDADDEPGEPARLAAPLSTAWVWFGRESRFALDRFRGEVAATMPGHHRTKAADRRASSAVDFAEAVCGSTGAGGWARSDGTGGGEADGAGSGEGDGTGGGDGDGSGGGDGDGTAADAFPFAAVARQFGPVEGDRIALGHGKPDGRLLTLGRGEVTEWDVDGSVTVERSMRGGGTYDALGVPKEEGDVAVTKLREGRWWYPTTYRDADGDAKGTYVNVCTPVELFPDCARYVDLYVDVIRRADGTVEVVDEDELDDAVAEGHVSAELAEKARSVAGAVERALSK